VTVDFLPYQQSVAETSINFNLDTALDIKKIKLMDDIDDVSCSSKIQIGFTFLVPAYPGCPGKETVKWL